MTCRTERGDGRGKDRIVPDDVEAGGEPATVPSSDLNVDRIEGRACTNLRELFDTITKADQFGKIEVNGLKLTLQSGDTFEEFFLRFYEAAQFARGYRATRDQEHWIFELPHRIGPDDTSVIQNYVCNALIARTALQSFLQSGEFPSADIKPEGPLPTVVLCGKGLSYTVGDPVEMKQAVSELVQALENLIK